MLEAIPYNPSLWKTTCPSCGALNDGATAPTEQISQQPKPGDLSVCLYCAAICVYLPDLQLRLATIDEVANIATSDPEGFRLISKFQKIARKKKFAAPRSKPNAQP
jgi:hypothetical protein